MRISAIARRARSVVLLALCTACVKAGTAPTPKTIQNEFRIPSTFDKVWTATIDVLAGLNLPISTLEKASGLVAINNVSYPMEWADEGTPGSTMGSTNPFYKREARFNIFVRPVDTSGVTLRVTTDFHFIERTGNGSEMFPYIDQPRQAYSNGKFEKVLVDQILTRVAK